MFATETFVNYKQNQAEYNSAVFCKYKWIESEVTLFNISPAIRFFLFSLSCRPWDENMQTIYCSR